MIDKVLGAFLGMGIAMVYTAEKDADHSDIRLGDTVQSKRSNLKGLVWYMSEDGSIVMLEIDGKKSRVKRSVNTFKVAPVKVFKDGGTTEDLFENPDKQPKSVRVIVEKYEAIEEEKGLDYSDLKKMQSELDKVGYTMDFELDAVPFNLRKKMAKGGFLPDHQYISPDDIVSVHTKNGKVYENQFWHKGIGNIDMISGLYISDFDLRKSEEVSKNQLKLFKKGGRLSEAHYIPVREIDYVTLDEDIYGEEKVYGKNLFNGVWWENTDSRKKLIKASGLGEYAKGGVTEDLEVVHSKDNQTWAVLDGKAIKTQDGNEFKGSYDGVFAMLRNIGMSCGDATDAMANAEQSGII